MAQHVLASGALDPVYPDTGLVLCHLASEQGDPAVVATGGGGAIVAWTDGRGVDTDIFALQVLAGTTAGVPGATPSGITLALPRPNPARGSVTLSFTLPHESLVRLDVYDAAGRRIRGLVSGRRSAGEHALTWDLRDEAARAVGAGLYSARLEAGGLICTRKLAALR